MTVLPVALVGHHLPMDTYPIQPHFKTSKRSLERLSWHTFRGSALGPVWKVYLFVVVFGRSSPIAESGQDGD